jgi:hypothetical protein
VYRLQLDLDCLGRLHVKVELCNLGLLYKGTKGSQNRLYARQVRYKIVFGDGPAPVARTMVRRNVCRFDVSVHRGGLIVDGTIAIHGEERP